jgi:hypothetical protein
VREEGFRWVILGQNPPEIALKPEPISLKTKPVQGRGSERQHTVPGAVSVPAAWLGNRSRRTDLGAIRAIALLTAP